MLPRTYLTILLLAAFSWANAQTHTGGPGPGASRTWVPDLGADSYRNPIVHADYSDPDVVRKGSDYYLTASSFNCVPGLPILHSTDLIHWRLIGHALPRIAPEDRYSRPMHGNGVWAPSIRYHNGWFYIYYPDPDLGIFMIKTRNPSGPWSTPVCVLPGKGRIDPCPLWDEDGQVYLVYAYAASRAGFNSVLTVAPLSVDGTHALDTGRMVYDGHAHNPTIEGPKLYKRNGYYYIFAPAGGVTTGWQVVLRSHSIYGPYTPKVVLAQGHTDVNGPHQGAWVETPSGVSWFFHFQDKGPYGRILHLEPMHWLDDWPVMGANPEGEPVSDYAKPGRDVPATPAESDEFNSHRLGLQWQWEANPQPSWSSLGNGCLRLFTTGPDTGNLWNTPNLLLQKFPAPDFVVTSKVRLGAPSCSGLLVMGSDYSYLALQQVGRGYQVVRRTCLHADKGGTEKEEAVSVIRSDSIYLRVEVRAPDARCKFSFSTDGVSFTELGPTFYAQPGRWIGAKVGLFCKGDPAATSPGAHGFADIDWFRVTKPGDGLPRSVDTAKTAWSLMPSRPENSVYQYAAAANNATAYLWIPPSCRYVRGIIIALSNLLERNWLEDPLIRQTAETEGLGIVWVSLHKATTLTADMGPASAETLQKLLDRLADTSGYMEIAQAPLLPMGHSAHGHFAWTVANWNPARTIAAIPIKTIPFPDTLGFEDVPLCYVVGQTTEWPQYRVPDPATHPGDRDFYWPVVTRGAVALRSADKDNLVGVVTDPGGGHFDWSERMARFVALYIRKACEYRLPPASPALRALRPEQGWLTDTCGLAPDHYPPAPYDAYKGDKRKAFWYFDEETAKAAADFEGDRRPRERQMPTFEQEGKPVPVAKIGFAPLVFEPDTDGLTIKVKGAFLDKMPPELIGSGTPLGHAAGPVQFKVITGPAEQTGPNTFKVRFDREGMGGDIWLLASHPGDDRYRYAVQPGKIQIPEKLTQGKMQIITFPALRADNGIVPLEATASLPVGYYVVSGPAFVEGDHLRLTPIPPRSKRPVAITVVAYQWGKAPLYQSAEIKTQTLYLK